MVRNRGGVGGAIANVSRVFREGSEGLVFDRIHKIYRIRTLVGGELHTQEASLTSPPWILPNHDASPTP